MGKLGEAVGGAFVEGAEYLGGLAVRVGEEIVSLAHYASPIVIAGVCLAAPEACEAAVAGGLVVETAIGAYEVLSNPRGVLEQLRSMPIYGYVWGLDQTTVLAGTALAVAELRVTAMALQGAAPPPGSAVVLVC